MNETTFKKWFEVPPTQNVYKKQTKIYYSSLKRNKPQFSKDDDRFMTPGPKTAHAELGLTSTKMTKGERLNSIKRSAIEVSRFIS
ncbi:MAG: hypothetical protein KDE33_28965 [Bacteroidetes bacterium]|nr:hypothetical protein [Bacteroidota bacterium]